ncbi:MAG: LD-carboxypeptidase [Bacteroidales bacterium]|nr:LD-carboxypeptidase [Bacteroidales bacterium]
MILKSKHIQNKKVGLIAPSGIVRQAKIDKTLQNIHSIGLSSFDDEIQEKIFGHFAGTDNQRLNDVHRFWTNEQIDAIFCIRGGSGATRLLNNINYKIIKNNPKIFVGFSDITALQSAFFVKTGLVSFHGIVGASEFTEYVIEQIKSLMFQSSDNYILPHKSFNTLKHGKTQGRIVGGNLSLLTSLIGTEYLYKFENNIVFIEEIAEPPYKIDRMLNHLLMATDLKKAAAIVFGKFNKCEPQDFDMTLYDSFSIEQIIQRDFSFLQIPVVYDLNFGHIKDALIFPIGINAQLDTLNQKITLLESATL